MAAARALAALLVLAAAGSALADEPRVKPVRIVSRVRQEAPAHGAGVEALGRSGPLNSDYYYLDCWSDWFNPIKPEAGGKQQATFYVTNWGGKCGETGDVDYTLPELLPLQTKAIKAAWKMPDTPGEAQVRVFLDSACTVFSGSADYVQWAYLTTVVEAGSKYAYLQLAKYNRNIYWGFDIEPKNPVVNGTLTANLAVVNMGTAPSEAGVKMAVYYDDSYYGVNTSECTHIGQRTVHLPKIDPGKTKVIPVKAPSSSRDGRGEIIAVLDASCMLGPKPADARTWSPYYYTTDKAGALLGGVQQNGQLSFVLKTTPKAPKANDTMTVKVKIINLGDADGPVGRVDLFLTSVSNAYVGYNSWDRCNPTGFIHSFNTTDLVIKPGKSKMVKITDVPAPGRAGWWGLVAVPDASCINEAESSVLIQTMPFSAFEVVAP
ncbi:hypothetical protein Rsub_02474 [Raphidocelis subcapitata]|uniref:CARDB domain-containing protein n=1 Tax=Raphidocelis subcapitata TaxID=307507 RepID=A0A2V0NRR1_9CHLO|nr:hypothetical protein Rsub_02474 [Raphidocelis subcapitata]|eukprot:GBF90368.1 hypothetical protein Rsub_02474 [Raphidocelis subcapitata]